MKNLVSTLIKYHFLILFILIEVFSLFLLVRNNEYQKTSFLQSSSIITGKIYQSWSLFTGYLALKEENQKLAVENAMLRTKSLASFKNNSTVYKLVNDTILRQQYVYTDARVINNSVYSQNNYLTLNKGSINGLKPEMGVICANGVIGVIKSVSKHYATVISLLNSNLKISVKLKKSQEIGSLAWDGKDYTKATLNEIPFHVKINLSDTIITSGYSAIFPEGIFAGTISGFNVPAGSNFYNIVIKLSTNFSNLSYVYVVSNLFKEEQKKLEVESENGQANSN